MLHSGDIRYWFKREIFWRNLISPMGFLLLGLVAAFMAYCGYHNLLIPAMILPAALIGLIVLYYCFFNPYLGFYVITVMAFFAFYPEHLFHKNFGISIIVEILTWIILLGAMMEKPPTGIKNDLINSPVSILFIIYTGFHLVEFFNPNMRSLEGYVFVMRKFLMFLWIYIIAYRVINTPKRLDFFFKFWIGMTFLAALYGCYQRYFGYLPAELAYIRSNPVEYGLMFQGGQLRIYSFLSDVVTFGVMCGSAAVITIIFAIYTKNKRRRYLLAFITIVMILGMLYSGTRTTNAILPSGISLYLLLTIKNKTTFIIVFISLVMILFVMYAPVYTPSIQRMRSTFNSDNPSLKIRDDNRHYIQPYIYKHPIGGGLATSGVAGRNYNPGHPLAGFPPDSGYLKMALEIGYIGFALSIVFYLSILYQYIYYCYRIKNGKLKLYAIATVCSLFSIMVTQYAQVTVGQIPQVIFFMALLPLSKRMFEFDKQLQPT